MKIQTERTLTVSRNEKPNKKNAITLFKKKEEKVGNLIFKVML